MKCAVHKRSMCRSLIIIWHPVNQMYYLRFTAIAIIKTKFIQSLILPSAMELNIS